MPHEVIMPALGMAQETGLLVRWLKSPGDAVAVGDLLFEVETDKSTMEVEAPGDGFLTDLRAEAGAEVPVGDVIALISETAEGTGAAPEAKAGAAATVEVPEPAPAANDTDLPDGAEVIMPALGMAQDAGLIVAWHKGLGEAVASGDVLFEVETDKATMEVEAGHDGYVAALLAEAGEEAPVGDVIAIISASAPDAPVQRSLAGKTQEARTPERAEEPAPTPDPEPKTGKPPVPKPATHGRILASPKARRLALEQGLDLNRLVQAGYEQPYHAADIETLKTLPAAGQSGLRITAQIPARGFTALLTWIEAETGTAPDPAAILAAMAGAALRRAMAADGLTIATETNGQTRSFPDPDRAGLGAAQEGDAPPTLLIRDLTGTRLTSISNTTATPQLCIGGAQTLTLTLDCAPDHLSAEAAQDFMTDLAGRLAEPLRHLL
ncbi:MAG: pyruvate dehydrogenase [Nioella sp.]|nr:pyruvate dehydrogenase [Nioella sp.]